MHPAVLTRPQAMALANVSTPRQWRRWTARFGLKPLSRGRYSLVAVNAAVAREVRGQRRAVA
jgi:hypothetical protein